MKPASYLTALSSWLAPCSEILSCVIAVVVPGCIKSIFPLPLATEPTTLTSSRATLSAPKAATALKLKAKPSLKLFFILSPFKVYFNFLAADTK